VNIFSNVFFEKSQRGIINRLKPTHGFSNHIRKHGTINHGKTIYSQGFDEIFLIPKLELPIS